MDRKSSHSNEPVVEKKGDQPTKSSFKNLNDPEMLQEYDFSQGIRGKYAKSYAQGSIVVVIDPDLAEFFPDHDSVNQALRSLVEIIKRQQKV